MNEQELSLIRQMATQSLKFEREVYITDKKLRYSQALAGILDTVILTCVQTKNVQGIATLELEVPLYLQQGIPLATVWKLTLEPIIDPPPPLSKEAL